MKLRHVIKQFNWRFLLVRILVNAVALVIIAFIVPTIDFVDKSIGNILLMAAMLGVLNAVVKPIIQFLTYPLIFATFGLITALTNALILMSLSWLFPNRFAVDNVLWALLGGLILGLLSSFLESLFGLSMPVVSDEPPEIRARLEEQAAHTDWFLTVGSEAASTETPATLAVENGPDPTALTLEPTVRKDPIPLQGGPGQGEKAPPPQEAVPGSLTAKVREATELPPEEDQVASDAGAASAPASQAIAEEDLS